MDDEPEKPEKKPVPWNTFPIQLAAIIAVFFFSLSLLVFSFGLLLLTCQWVKSLL